MRVRQLIALALPCLLIFFIMPAATGRAEDFGKFLDELDVRLLGDGRKVKLLTDYRFQDPSQDVWTARNGWEVDGASIPRIFWTIIGAPLDGPYRNASVIHDYYCDTKEKKWEDTHLTFYYAMRASGVDELKAKIMYYAVYKFGPRWKQVAIQHCAFLGGRSVCREEITMLKAAPVPGPDELDDVKMLQEQLAASATGPKITIEELQRRANENKWRKFPQEMQ